MTATRNEKMDFFKGILMFGVIWGHMITNLLGDAPNNTAIHWIMRTYDMPLFMVISGFFLWYSLSNRSLPVLLADKFTTILVPTVLWDLAISYGRSFGALYFLWAVFLSSVIMAIIVKCIKNNGVRILLCVLITVGLNFIPLGLWNMSYLFPFLVMGYFINEFKIDIFNKVSLAWGGLAFIVLLCFWKTDFTIWNTGTYFKELSLNSVGIVLFRYVIAFVGSIAFISVFSIVYDYYAQHRTKVFDFICKSGQETLAVYILQIFVICKVLKNVMLLIINKIGYNPLLLNEHFYGYVITPVLSVLVLVVIYQITIALKRNKITKYLFGFKLPLKHA